MLIKFNTHTSAAESIGSKEVSRIAGTKIGAICVGAIVLTEVYIFKTLMHLCKEKNKHSDCNHKLVNPCSYIHESHDK